MSQRLTSDDHCPAKNVLWHPCYEAYTSKQNLRYAYFKTSNNPSEVKVSRRSVVFDWSKGIFCKNATRKKDKNLINIVTFEACNTIRESAEARVDHQMLGILQSFNDDLIAAGGKYHKACHSAYVSKVNIKRTQRHFTTSTNENPFDKAFDWLVEVITHEINNGKAYDMNTLLAMFKQELKKLSDT